MKKDQDEQLRCSKCGAMFRREKYERFKRCPDCRGRPRELDTFEAMQRPVEQRLEEGFEIMWGQA